MATWTGRICDDRPTTVASELKERDGRARPRFTARFFLSLRSDDLGRRLFFSFLRLVKDWSNVAFVINFCEDGEKVASFFTFWWN